MIYRKYRFYREDELPQGLKVVGTSAAEQSEIKLGSRTGTSLIAPSN